MSGHVGGHLRDPFCDLVHLGEMEADADHRGQTLTPWRLTGLLWNCTDVMPRDVCAELDVPQGSSYAVGARGMRRELRRVDGAA